MAAGAYIAHEVIDGLATANSFTNKGTMAGGDIIGGDSGSDNTVDSDLSSGARLTDVANDSSDNRDFSDNSDRSDRSDNSDNSVDDHSDNSTTTYPAGL